MAESALHGLRACKVRAVCAEPGWRASDDIALGASKVDGVRRSSSATAAGRIWQAGGVHTLAGCHNGVDYESRCDMACCKSGRRSKRRRRNNPMLQRADCGTGATPGPVAQTALPHAIGQLHTISQLSTHAATFTKLQYRSMTRRNDLLRDYCATRERKRWECTRKKQPKSWWIPPRLQLHRYAASSSCKIRWTVDFLTRGRCTRRRVATISPRLANEESATSAAFCNSEPPRAVVQLPDGERGRKRTSTCGRLALRCLLRHSLRQMR